MHSDADMTAGDPAHETTSGLPADPDTASPTPRPETGRHIYVGLHRCRLRRRLLRRRGT